MKSAVVKSTAPKAAEATPTVEPAGHVATTEAATDTSTMEAAASEASTTMEAATTAHAAPVAATAASTARQSHCWRSQANGRDCQQRDRCFMHHQHSPSEILLPAGTMTLNWESC
jgi:hypothetical protein